MKKRLLEKQKLSPIKKILIGTIIIILTYISLSMIICAFVFFKNYAPSKYVFLSVIALTASGAIGTFVNARILKSNINESLLSIILLTAIYLSAVLIFNGKIFGSSIMNSACFVLSSVIFAYIGNRRKEKRHTVKRHH